MFDPNILKDIQVAEEAARAQKAWGGFPTSELIDSAARIGDMANQIGHQEHCRCGGSRAGGEFGCVTCGGNAG